MSHLAEALRLYLVVRVLSQDKVAEEIGWSRFQLTRFINGQNCPDIDHLNRLFEWMVTSEKTKKPRIQQLYVDRVERLEVSTDVGGVHLDMTIRAGKVSKTRFRNGDKPPRYKAPKKA